jgi:hypothetical protein
MATFTLDTSGYVQCPAPNQKPNESAGCWFWSDLSPFAQGYVEAMFSDLIDDREDIRGIISAIEYGGNTGTKESAPNALRRYKRLLTLGFRDIAPETLALILRDCTNYGHGYSTNAKWRERPNAGADFWRQRQQGLYGEGRGNAFPPLTPCLGDDGKVYLRETGQ